MAFRRHSTRTGSPPTRKYNLRPDNLKGINMLKTLMFAITLVFALPASLLAQVRPAQVTVITSGGFSASHEELLPQFEKALVLHGSEGVRGSVLGKRKSPAWLCPSDLPMLFASIGRRTRGKRPLARTSGQRVPARTEDRPLVQASCQPA